MALDNSHTTLSTVTFRMRRTSCSKEGIFLLKSHNFVPEFGSILVIVLAEGFRNSICQVTQGSINESSIDHSKGSILLSVGLFKDRWPELSPTWSSDVAEFFASLPEEEMVVNDNDIFLSIDVELDAKSSAFKPFVVSVQEDEFVSCLLASEDSDG